LLGCWDARRLGGSANNTLLLSSEALAKFKNDTMKRRK